MCFCAALLCVMLLARRGCLLKLQRHLHELLLDQLPVLRQLSRVLDEMALGINNAAAAAGAGSRLILEQVGTIRRRAAHSPVMVGGIDERLVLVVGKGLVIPGARWNDRCNMQSQLLQAETPSLATWRTAEA